MNIRVAHVKQLLKESNLDALLVSSVPNIFYLTNYHGFSYEEREAYLLICKNGQYIITDPRYSEAVKKKVADFQLMEISGGKTLSDILKELAKKHQIKKLGIEEDDLRVSEYKLFSSYFNNLNHFTLSDLRAIKNPREIKEIEKACQLGDKAFKYILTKVKPGVSEKELASQLEQFVRQHGAEPSFSSIVAFGKNSAVPHHTTSNQRLATSNQFVLFDFGVKINNYCSDMTRTVFFGSASAEQKKMYNTVLQAQGLAIEKLNSFYSSSKQSASRSAGSQLRSNNIEACRIDSIARSHIVSQGYPTIPHSLGHGIGLQVHESPRLSPNSKDELKSGMVFSIEPGIYKLDSGGVRIEDLVVLEEKGPRMLTKTPRQLISLSS